jgi:hypothetical protein
MQMGVEDYICLFSEESSRAFCVTVASVSMTSVVNGTKVLVELQAWVVFFLRT